MCDMAGKRSVKISTEEYIKYKSEEIAKTICAGWGHGLLENTQNANPYHQWIAKAQAMIKEGMEQVAREEGVA